MGVPLFGTSGWDSDLLLRHGSDAVEGAVFTAASGLESTRPETAGFVYATAGSTASHPPSSQPRVTTPRNDTGRLATGSRSREGSERALQRGACSAPAEGASWEAPPTSGHPGRCSRSGKARYWELSSGSCWGWISAGPPRSSATWTGTAPSGWRTFWTPAPAGSQRR